MPKHIFLLMTLVLALTVNSAFAVEVKGLDQASVPVASRSVADKNIALKAALAAVVVKNTGDDKVLQNPVIAGQLNNPNAFLVQFGYEELDGQLYLKGQFDERRVVQLLRQAQVPVWGKQRPLILVWLSVQDAQQQRGLLSDASTSDIRTLFKQDAEAKGLPLSFPLMDLDDMMQVSEADVRGNFPSTIYQASTRYHADYFVLASIRLQADGRESYRFYLYPMKQNVTMWRPLLQSEQTVATDPNAVVNMVTALSQYFVSQYAVADSGAGEQVDVVFDGIDSMARLKALETYVAQLTVARSAVIARIQGNRVTYRFTLYGSPEELARQLNLESRLEHIDTQAVSDFTSPVAPAPTMEYHWQ
ncbi:MAG: DUF2066 domain-containing protein [Shewanella sp.]|nr:DUF2066 domain-containing protein [Shewanella sp.]MCF1437927.1 DUF2066 domain-containing protein [Shewanella sp.]